MKNRRKLAWIAPLLLTSSFSQAAMVLINNHDFEDNPAADNNYGGQPNDWTGLAGGSGTGRQDLDNTVGVINTAIYLNADDGIGQDITSAIAGNSVAIGDVFTLNVTIGVFGNGSPDMLFDIRTTSVDGASLIGGPQSLAAPTSTFTNQMAMGTVDTASSSVFLVLTHTAGQVFVDDVSLDLQPVPEPSSAALLGLGGLALILRRRK